MAFIIECNYVQSPDKVGEHYHYCGWLKERGSLHCLNLKVGEHNRSLYYSPRVINWVELMRVTRCTKWKPQEMAKRKACDGYLNTISRKSGTYQ